MMRFDELPFARIAEAMRVDTLHVQDQVFEAVDRVISSGSDGFLQFSACLGCPNEEMIPLGTGLSVVPRMYHDGEKRIKGALVTLSVPLDGDWVNEEWLVTLPDGDFRS